MLIPAQTRHVKEGLQQVMCGLDWALDTTKLMIVCAKVQTWQSRLAFSLPSPRGQEDGSRRFSRICYLAAARR